MAPLGTIIVAGLFVLAAAYALSSARLIRRLVFLDVALVLLTFMCLIRAALTFQLQIRHPELVSSAHFEVALGWLVAGVALGLGKILVQHDNH